MKILLRAWLPDKKKMLHHDEIILIEGKVLERVYDQRTGYMNSFARDNAILMIYTGLKDRNKIPIFNGDIIKKTTAFGEIIGEAEFFKGVLQFKTSKYGLNYRHFSNTFEYKDMGAITEIPQYYEKIGNIYENPELLSSQ